MKSLNKTKSQQSRASLFGRMWKYIKGSPNAKVLVAAFLMVTTAYLALGVKGILYTWAFILLFVFKFWTTKIDKTKIKKEKEKLLSTTPEGMKALRLRKKYLRIFDLICFLLIIYPALIAGLRGNALALYEIWEKLWKPLVDILKPYIPMAVDMSKILFQYGYEGQVSYIEHIAVMGHIIVYFVFIAHFIWFWRSCAKISSIGAYKVLDEMYNKGDDLGKALHKKIYYDLLQYIIICIPFVILILHTNWGSFLENRIKGTSVGYYSYVALTNIHENDYAAIFYTFSIGMPLILLLCPLKVIIEQCYERGYFIFSNRNNRLLL